MPCSSQWNIGHRPVHSIQLCPMLSPLIILQLCPMLSPLIFLQLRPMLSPLIFLQLCPMLSPLIFLQLRPMLSPLIFLQLCPMLSPQSSSSSIWNLMSTFLRATAVPAGTAEVRISYVNSVCLSVVMRRVFSSLSCIFLLFLHHRVSVHRLGRWS